MRRQQQNPVIASTGFYGCEGHKPCTAIQAVKPRLGDCVDTACVAGVGVFEPTDTEPPVTVVIFTVLAAVPAFPVTVTAVGKVADAPACGAMVVYGPVMVIACVPIFPLIPAR